MYNRFALATLILILTVLASGVYVRATGSGLACPDVPNCYGFWWPPERLPPGTLGKYPGFLYDAFQAGTQMLHRILAAVVGVLLAGLVVSAWWQPKRRTALLGSLGLLGLYLIQVTLGASVVTSRLMPALVTAHWLVAVFMAGTALLWYLRLVAGAQVVYEHTKELYRYACFAWVIASLQLILGAWVAGNHAALACTDFPTCQGSWWPPLNWDAFAFWRQWGAGLSGWVLPDSGALITIHWMHRVGAALSFVILFGLGIAISSNPKVPHLSKAGLVINFLLLVAVTLGISLVLKRIPPPLVVAHSMVAVLLWLIVTAVVVHLRRGPPVSVPAGEKGVTAEVVPVPEVLPPPETLFDRLRSRLDKTRQGLTGFLSGLSLAGRRLDEDLLEEIETHLLMADVGVDATREIIGRLDRRLVRHQVRDSAEVRGALRDTLLEILEPCSQPLRIDPAHKPYVILVVGVNGVGKTTTIGKLAKRLRHQGHSVMLAAGDTFRAAAVEQLKVWGERNQVPVISQETGADSASVIYDSLQAAKARGVDVLIADTAGRLHTKSNLMEELAKIRRILGKIDPSAPHEVLLVVDATTGQNALAQAEQFNSAVGVTGIALTKLDGTAKGGVIFALARRFGIPIRLIGIGEGIEDLQDFDARLFVEALFPEPPREEARVVH